MKTRRGQPSYITFIAKIVQLFIAGLGRGHDAGHLKSTSMDNLFCLHNTCEIWGYERAIHGYRKKEIGYLHGYCT